MLKTFNCGIGMIVCVAAEDEAATLELLTKQGETVYVLGEIKQTKMDEQVIYLD